MTAFRAAFKAYRMHQVLILPRFARLTFALGLATAVFPVDAEYYFNPRFLSNDLAESVDLSAFTKGREAPPGTYRVDIYLNDEFMASRDITFIADDNNADLIPCLSTDLLVSLGIKKSALLDNKEHSADKHVPLQKNSARQFPTTGSTSPAVPFQITLSECSKGTTGVRVAFNGIEDAENNTLLKLDEGSNTASGLGIEILDGNMRPVKLNDLHAGMQWIPLVPDQNNILPYSARLKSTQKSVNPGLVSASATFTLEFQ